MTYEMMPAVNNNEKMDLGRLDQIKAEIGSISNSLTGNIDQLRAMVEIAKDRGFEGSSEIGEKSNEVLKKFEPGGEYASVLYQMISDLNSIKSEAFSEGLEITQDQFNQKLEELKS